MAKSAPNQVRIAIMDCFDFILSSNSSTFELSLTQVYVKSCKYILECFQLSVRHLPYSNAWNWIDIHIYYFYSMFNIRARLLILLLFWSVIIYKESLLNAGNFLWHFLRGLVNHVSICTMTTCHWICSTPGCLNIWEKYMTNNQSK